VYVKSQHLDCAQRMFDEMCDRDVISCSAQCEESADALWLF